MKKRTKKRMEDNRIYLLILIVVLILGAFLSLYFFYGPSWINGSDNYIYASEAHQLVTKGNIYFGGLEDNVKLLLFFGNAIFIKLLGYNLFSLSLFGVSCFLGTIIVIYLIGKNLYNLKAGLISAFFYAIFPIVVINSANVGDDVPMTFFVSLAVLFAVLAIKKDKTSKPYYILAGFVSAISYIIVPEGAIGAVFVLFIFGMDIVCNLVRKKKINKSIIGIALGIAGIVIAVAFICLLGFIENGHLLSIFSTVNSNLTPWQTTPGESAYLNWLFPTSNLINNIAKSPFFFNQMAFGYFGFAFVISASYLLILRDKRIMIPLLWFLITFLYLGYGSQSITRYIPVLILLRFTIIFCPAIALMIGFGFTRIIEAVKKRHKVIKIATYVIVAGSILFFFICSFLSIRYINYSQRNSVSALVQTGNYINHLGLNVTVFGPVDLPWVTYTNYKASLLPLSYIRLESNCNVTKIFVLEPGDYMVGELNGSYSSCGFVMVFKPHKIEWLANYTAFNNDGMNISDIAVYLYR